MKFDGEERREGKVNSIDERVRREERSTENEINEEKDEHLRDAEIRRVGGAKKRLENSFENFAELSNQNEGQRDSEEKVKDQKQFAELRLWHRSSFAHRAQHRADEQTGRGEIRRTLPFDRLINLYTEQKVNQRETVK